MTTIRLGKHWYLWRQRFGQHISRWFLAPGRNATQDESAANASGASDMYGVSVQQFLELTRYFPIGQAVRYFPGNQFDIRLPSLVLGYRINGHYLFLPSDYRIESQGGQPRLYLTSVTPSAALTEIQDCALILPHEAATGERLDYPSRAELPQQDAFQQGHNITLVGGTYHQDTPHLLTRVARTEQLHRGVYTNHRVVHVGVVPNGLSFIDQRRYYRVRTQLPATMHILNGEAVYHCRLSDFSETAASVTLDVDDQEAVNLLREGRRVGLEFTLPGTDAGYVLQGRILRRDHLRMVVRLEDICQGDEFLALTELHVLDMKSKLLQLQPIDGDS